MKKIIDNFKRVYKKPFVFNSINLVGIVFAVVGIIICLSLAFSSFYIHSKFKTASQKIEDVFVVQLDKTDKSVEKIKVKVESFTKAQDLFEYVDEEIDVNIERIDSARTTMQGLNFSGKLDGAISKADNLRGILEDLKDLNQTAQDFKAQVIAKLKNVLDRIDSAKEEVQSTARTFRWYSFLGSLSIVIVSIILLLGEISLIRRCGSNFKNRKVLATY